VVSFQEALRLEPNNADAPFILAKALEERGKVEGADRQAAAYNEKAVQYFHEGRLQDAVAAFQQALRVQPHYADAHSNLGNVLAEQHKFKEAEAVCREAVRLQPAEPGSHNNLGNALKGLGKLDEAAASYREALRLQPSFAEAHHNLSLVLAEQHKRTQAIESYRETIRLKPDAAEYSFSRGNAHAHYNVGKSRQEQGKFEDAAASYRRALQLRPDYAEAHAGLSVVLTMLDKPEEAAACLKEALRLKRNLPEVYSDLGDAQAQMGDIAGAEASFREASRLDPRYTCSLALLLGARLSDSELNTVRRVLAAPDLPDWKRCQVHYALTRVHDARGEHVEAAQHAQRANALDRALRPKRGQMDDPAEHTRFVDLIISTFTPDFFRHVRGWGVESEIPVFVFGLPRSGTTLVEQILASHSRVHGAGERALSWDAFFSLAKNKDAVEPVIKEGAEEGFVVLGTDRERVHRVATNCFDRLRALHSSATRIVDKMPDNYLYLGLLATLFPRARFIHCRRDLRDVALSCWLTSFKQVNWANDQGAMASRFREYRRLMAHWRQVLPVPILEVSYEKVVADLETEARRLVAGCGLEWEPACLAFHQTRRPVHTASAIQVRQPIYSQSVGRWRHYAETLAPLFAQLEADAP
jgi:tetratricopeptide (TPR) repeat protein